MMWDGRIFLKTSVPLSKDLSNEPNFSRINLAGHWTVPLKADFLQNVTPLIHASFLLLKHVRLWDLFHFWINKYSLSAV
jgi:hypothetical protein